jgi:beta-phosphoglucomutase family hydrolase
VTQLAITGIQGLIFDMDGVIVDSEPLHLLAYQELFGGCGLPYTAEQNSEFLGCKDLHMCEILIERHKLPWTAPDMVLRKEEILTGLLQSQAAARSGLYEILERAKSLNIPRAIASSATLATINIVVDVLKIRDYFQTLTSGEEVEHGKPAPDVFLLAARRLGVLPQNCLVIEDTYNGIKAAKAAGMFCVAIPCAETKHQDHSMADLNLESLLQVDLEAMCAGK